MKLFTTLIVVLTIIFLLNCRGSQDKKEVSNKDSIDINNNKINLNKISKTKDDHNSLDKDKKIDLEFENFNCFVESQGEDKNGFTILKYTIEINFSYNKNFKVKYEIFDKDNNTIFVNEKDVENSGKNTFFIRDNFSDQLSHRVIRYKITSFLKDREIETGGEFINNSLPDIKSISFGPIVTSYLYGKFSVNSSIEILINNAISTKWIRLIPPSENYFWEIPFSINYNDVVSNATIYDENNLGYFENGKYIIQVNFGKFGLIQEEFQITDIFGNISGKNYGLPIAFETQNDKNLLKFSISYPDKIDNIHLELYETQNKTVKKIGVAKFISPILEINKKELINLFKDDYEQPIKLKFNKKYLYKIVLFSKEYNKVSYQSFSELKSLVFSGFSFW